jgi:hypothetical protein
MPDSDTNKAKPGICMSWEEIKKDLPAINGDEELFKRIWEDNDSLGYMYIWQMLLSF